MERTKAHCEEKEPLMEKILGQLRFRRIINDIPGNSHVLDLGCGYNGKLLGYIADKIQSGTGIDISVNPELANNKISLLSHDLNTPLPFESETFDVVASLANLEHLKYPEKNIQEIYRVLKSGGLLLLTTPTTYAKPVLEFLAFKLKLISEQEITDHKTYYNKNSLCKTCKKVGFSSCQHRYFQLFMNNYLIARK